MERPTRPETLRPFLLVWSGQTVSFVGSSTSGFALGLWVYEQTGTATGFALSALFLTLPSVLVAPLAGVYVDRWDRRRVMIVSDAVAALVTAGLLAMLVAGSLSVTAVYAGAMIGGVAQTCQQLAYYAGTTQLVPASRHRRAVGLIQLEYAVGQTIAPLLGGALLGTVGLSGILALDLLTFCAAFAGLLMVRFPSVGSGGQGGPEGVWREARAGLRFVGDRGGLVALLVLFGVSNALLGMVTVLTTPLVLSFASVDALGSILTAGGVSMILGSALMSVWGGPRRAVFGILGAHAVAGVATTMAGLRPSVAAFAASMIVFSLAVAVVQACSQSIWQRKVPADLQGRVFAVRRLVGRIALVVGYLVCGPLADRVFEPLGSGPGQGTALLFVTVGALIVATTGGLALYAPLRRVELDVPDIDAVRAT